MWLLDQYWEVLNQLGEKFNSQEVFPEFPACFKLISQLATRLCSVLYKLPLDLACLQSAGKRNISKLCLFWNYCGYSFICFTACLQVIKVSTVYVFLGRGLLEQDSESKEDQYLFEICLVEHSAQNLPLDCQFMCFQLSKPIYSLSQLEVIRICCISLVVTC